MKQHCLYVLFIACFSMFIHANEKISESEWKKVISKKDYTETYKEYDPKEKDNKLEKTFSSSTFNSKSIKIAVVIVIVAILTVLLVLLVIHLLKIKTTHKVSNNIKIEEIDDPDQFKLSDLEKYLMEALENNNYRLAIRIHFLILIKALNENEFILWKKEKTNLDYLQEVKGHEFYADFKYLIKVFEKIWYANYSIEQSTYNNLAVKFVEIPKILRNER